MNVGDPAAEGGGHLSWWSPNGIYGCASGAMRELARVGGWDGKAENVRRSVFAGGLIFVVAFFALFVVTYSSKQLFGLSLTPAGAVGALIGCLIALWDLLLVQLVKSTSRRPMLATSVRVGGALLVGALFTASILISSYAPDIDMRMDQLRLEQVDTSPRIQQLQGMLGRRDDLQRTIANPDRRSYTDDPDVIALTRQLRDADDRNEAQELRIAGEEAGPGGKPTAEDLVLQTQFDTQATEVRTKLRAKELTVMESIRVEGVARAADARSELDTLQSDITARTSEKSQLEDQAAAANNGPAPRLPSIEAITRLAGANPVSLLVGLALCLVFSALLLPPALINVFGERPQALGVYGEGEG